jgi:hypothetical protein
LEISQILSRIQNKSQEVAVGAVVKIEDVFVVKAKALCFEKKLM